MLQSSVSLFGNSYVSWNIQKLKEILKIPQDQLNILNNIPGWASKRNNISEKTVLLSSEKESNKNSCESLLTSEQQNLVHPPINTKFATAEEAKSSSNAFLHIKKNNFHYKTKVPKKRSSSLSSLTKIEETNSNKLKRSTSVPNMSDPVVFSDTALNKFETSNACHEKTTNSKTKQLFNVQTLKEVLVNSGNENVKSQFTHSAVQCQMSQNSQPDLELPLSERILLSTVSSNLYEKDKSYVSNARTESEKNLKKYSIPPTDMISSNFGFKKMSKKLEVPNLIAIDFNDKKANLSEEIQVPADSQFKNSITDFDKSYVSQPISCAQLFPIENNCLQNKVPLICVQTNQSSTLPDVSSKTHCITSQSSYTANKHVESVTKRKRKKKQEKQPKKFRGITAYEVEIHYTYDQIKNMIEIMKVLKEFP